MKPAECEFESDALAAALESRWPGHVDGKLRAHVAACEICSEVVAVAGAIELDREAMRAQAVVPDSGRVWWLAQMRARREAAKSASRPITAAQVLSLACAVGLLGACFGATSTWFQAVLVSIGRGLAGFKFEGLLPSVIALLAEHGALALAGAALLLLVPAAVCFAMFRE